MENNSRLVDAEGLLAALFQDGARPCVRWVRNLQKRRAIPFIKVGRLVRFDVVQVRESLDRKNTIRAKGDR